jgi:hypothetical protein
MKRSMKSVRRMDEDSESVRMDTMEEKEASKL